MVCQNMILPLNDFYYILLMLSWLSAKYFRGLQGQRRFLVQKGHTLQANNTRDGYTSSSIQKTSTIHKNYVCQFREEWIG